MKLRLAAIYILVLFLIYSCSSSLFLESHEDKLIPVNEKPDSVITAIISPYKIGIDSIMNEVLCYSELEMKKGKPESLLGNFVTDLCLDQFSDKADMCVMNNGGLRSVLQKGNITRRDIYTLMPFENELVIVELNRKEKKELFSYIASRGGEPFSGSVIVITNKGEVKDQGSGSNQHTHSRKWISAKGDTFPSVQLFRNDTICEICGLNYMDDKIRVLTSDYLANGGDKMKFFKEKTQEKVGMKVRDAIINYCLSTDTISASLDGRIRYEK